MISACVDAVNGRRPFDTLIRDVKIVNVFDNSITEGSIGIIDGIIALTGDIDESYTAKDIITGDGCYAFSGFIDSHMHLESSMLNPAYFARLAISNGTTTVSADPHEIGNVLGKIGVLALKKACEGLPLRVLMMAPSTVPSAPGLEGSGYCVAEKETEEFLDSGEIDGLGEVMDFNGVAAGEKNILSVIEAARRRGAIIDGHASILTGKRLAAFRACGIDSDHTVPSADKLKEELALGFTVQIQDCMLGEEIVRAMNEAPVNDRICLTTDDVPLDTLMTCGHLNSLCEKAVGLGLEPVKAIRYCTINPATRLRLYDTGAIAPGMKADIQLVRSLDRFVPELVISGGRVVFQNGKYFGPSEKAGFPDSVYNSINLARKITLEDFVIKAGIVRSGTDRAVRARVNIISQDSLSIRTKRTQCDMNCDIMADGTAVIKDFSPMLKMAVFNRYGEDTRGLALIDGEEEFDGAVAITYGHDCHNLTVYGSRDEDMLLACETVCKSGGGICFVRRGEIEGFVPLPVAGLLSEDTPEELHTKLKKLINECRKAGLKHKKPMTFFTLMPLAVSPEIKCTDKGLVDSANKCFIPLVEELLIN